MSNPVKPTDVGRNRTGIATSPIDSRAMIEGATGGRALPGDGVHLTKVRVAFSRDAEPVGTMPPPASLKGIAKSALQKLKGHSPMVLLDKMGERLAYERTGARLYEALLAKFEASHAQDPSVTVQALQEIHDDELRHAGILHRAIEQMGGDPTTMTPCADVMGLASSGFVQVLSDPRSTFTQCLGAMLLVEVGDNSSWELLVELAESLGQDDIADDFRLALTEETRHVELVRRWLANAVMGQAGAEEGASTTPVV